MALGTEARSALQMLWTTWGQLLHRHLLPQRVERPRANRTGAGRWINRSSLTMSSASSVPVEKSGPDFHRLTLLSLLKSPIRSIPKSGSGTILLRGRGVAG